MIDVTDVRGRSSTIASGIFYELKPLDKPPPEFIQYQHENDTTGGSNGNILGPLGKLRERRISFVVLLFPQRLSRSLAKQSSASIVRHRDVDHAERPQPQRVRVDTLYLTSKRITLGSDGEHDLLESPRTEYLGRVRNILTERSDSSFSYASLLQASLIIA